MADIGGMRKPYRRAEDVFDVESLVSTADPYEQFRAWFEEATNHPEIEEANAMALATATKDGAPSVRLVLLKGYGPDLRKVYNREDAVAKHGFVFFTNDESRKGNEIRENPRASLMFYWAPLKRSVRIEGDVVRICDDISTDYFKSRPLSSQIGAWVSQQSRVISCRKELTDKEEELKNLFTEENACDLKKPDNWGGYCVMPKSFEFWQGQTSRIHDRIRFRREDSGSESKGGWIVERLAP